MNKILEKVNQAKRRLYLQSLVHHLPKFLFGFLCVALVAIAIPKFVAIPNLTSASSEQIWLNSWAWGSVAVAALACLAWTYMTRESSQNAAHQIDKHYGLKERVSTSMSLAEKQESGDFAEAVINDASNRMENVEIPAHFPIQTNWWSLIPAVPALAIIAISFLPQAISQAELAKLDQTNSEKNKPKDLKKVALKKKGKKANPDAKSEIETNKVLNKKINTLKKKIDNEKLPKKDQLIAINDIKKTIRDKQKQLGKTKAFKKMLDGVKKGTSGLSKKIKDAIGKGDFKKAQDAIKKISDKLAKGELTKKEAQKLAEELSKLKKEFEKNQKDFENKKKDLQRQIDQAKKNGNQEKADELERKKDQLEQQQRQRQQMDNICKECDKIAQAVKKAANNKNGKPNQQQMKQIQEAMKNLEGQLKEMDLDKKQAEKLQELMDEMEALQKECNGQGKMQGMPKQGKGKGKGKGMGEGKGTGDRPIGDDPDKKFRDVRSRQKITGKGEVTKIGEIGGANRKGRSIADIRKEIQNAAKTQQITPDNIQNIPPHLREHVKDYFKKSDK